MIALLALALAQQTASVTPQIKARSMHASLFVFPVLKDLVDAITEDDEAKFARHVQSGAMLTDADGNIFPLRTASLRSLVSTCTFQAMAYNSDPIYDDGIVYWSCPKGLSQLHFKMRDGVVVSASPFRHPASERPKN